MICIRIGCVLLPYGVTHTTTPSGAAQIATRISIQDGGPHFLLLTSICRSKTYSVHRVITQKTVLSSLIESTWLSVLCKSSIGKDMDSVDVAVTMPDRQLEDLLQMDDDEDAGKNIFIITSKIGFFLLCRMGRFI